jgi:DnaJ-class molecular chaperone
MRTYPKLFVHKCDHCNGAGTVTCPHCRGHKIKRSSMQHTLQMSSQQTEVGRWA